MNGQHWRALAAHCCTKPRQVDRSITYLSLVWCLKHRGKPDTAIMSKRSRTPSPSTYSRSPISDSITPSERSKIIHRDSVPVIEAMHCALPPHRETLSFASYEDYEVHYHQAHVNRCAECSKNFPTGHFLNLHIEENHDALAAARKARGEKTVSVHCLNFNYCSCSCSFHA